MYLMLVDQGRYENQSPYNKAAFCRGPFGPGVYCVDTYQATKHPSRPHTPPVVTGLPFSED